MLFIDGSFGEGGGQIIRTALGLAALSQTPLHILNIRAKRSKPGLRPQHLACVKAMQVITQAEVRGVHVGSKELIFVPKGIFPGDYKFDIGTAGSTSLLLQCLLLPLSHANRPSMLVLKGGTHVPFSPPFHYLKHVFVPMLSKIGIKLELELINWGWYPKGGGEIRVKISPQQRELTEHQRKWEDPPSFVSLKALSAAANLPHHIVTQQAKRLSECMQVQGFSLQMLEETVQSKGKGSFLFLWIDEEIKAGFSALGARGKPAERVAEEVCHCFIRYLKAKVALDEHLADQLIPFLALTPGVSSFTTVVSSHLITNVEVTKKILKCNILVEGKMGYPAKVTVITI